MSDYRTQTESQLTTSAEILEVEELLGYALPESYRTYLLNENGMNGFVGSNYVRFYSAQNLSSENYEDWKEFFPNTLRIGDTGALENFVVNYDFSPPRFGILPHIGNKDDFIELGTEWEQLIDRLASDTVWDKHVRLKLDGSVHVVPTGTTVAVAILSAEKHQFRRSVSGEPRGPLCGMGICFECRVTIDGLRHQRSCTILAESGMEVVTDD
jgi:D-hydroxyproline dehydrogenase subunit gamma